ncbi:MAG: inositol monophosphatase family protein [Balneolaceae bacterium]
MNCRQTLETMQTSEKKELLTAAREIAREGGDCTLDYFKQRFDLEYKNDDSPVTNADREAESTIRKAIEARYPDHGIIGEEYGTDGEDRDVVWIVDPIDGTQSFIHGVPFYTTLIGVVVKGEPVVGIIYAPALGELLEGAVGLGARLNGEPCRVRECRDLSKATILTTDQKNITKYGFDTPFQELLQRSRLHRTWGDAYGHLMVATGRADLMFDPVLHIWDAAALLPVIREAGGSFTDVHGVETIETGNGISCSPGLKEEWMSLFNKPNEEGVNR